MTWWPSVPTRAVMAPTIAGSSSTTRIRRGRVGIVIMFLSGADEMAEVGGKTSDRDRSGQRHDESSAVGSRRFAPEASAHGLAEPLGGVEPDPGSAGGVGVTARVRFEDPLPPLGG